MQCVHPFYRGRVEKILTPCGKCIGCKKEKARQWSIRLQHELYTTKDHKNCFLTLTYNDENLKDISKRELQLFFKRLRKEFDNRKIKYFACGEYGETTGRPHYHALIFGIGGLKDLRMYKLQNGKMASTIIEKIWKCGNNLVGTVEPKSINYVVGYVKKQVNYKPPAPFKTGAFQLVSNGIGESYVYEDENRIRKLKMTMNGNKVTIPRYYIKKLEIDLVKLDIESERSEENISNYLQGYKEEFFRDRPYYDEEDLFALHNEQKEKNKIAKDNLFHKRNL